MARITFEVEDTPANRSQIALLCQIKANDLDRAAKSRTGKLLLDFENVADPEAVFILTKAVSNHGFVLEIPETVVPTVRQRKS